MKIEEIDRNFQVAQVGNQAIVYRDALQAPFELEGFPWRDPALVFNRLPAGFTEQDVNAGALSCARHTAGGAVRFRTDSPRLALRTALAHSLDLNHMPRAASAGFDLYRGAGRKIAYQKTVQPNSGQQALEALLVPDGARRLTDWTLYLPLYGAAAKIEIGLAPGARLESPTSHAVARPVLFYGSSITQGGCASRPGNAYTTMLCRAVDAPQINLGFSGSALGEPAVAAAIAGLDLAALILDYEHNSPSLEHLQNTHERFFRIIRDRRPALPVLILSKCDFWGAAWEKERRAVVRRTWERAAAAGDTRVWFIDGAGLFGRQDRDACTVDRCHPNDLGFYRMFREIGRAHV